MPEDNFSITGDVHPVTGKVGLLTGDKVSQAVTIQMDYGYGDMEKSDGRINFSLGNTSRVGDGIDASDDGLTDLIGNMMTAKHNVDEIGTLLDAVVKGDGLNGVSYEICSDDTIIIAFANADATDYLTLTGLYMEEYLATLPDGYRVNNNADQFQFLDFDEEFNLALGVEPGGGDDLTNNTIINVVGNRLTNDELEGLLDEYVSGTMHKTEITVCETDDIGTSTVVLKGAGNNDTFDTIIIENVDDLIIPTEFFDIV